MTKSLNSAKILIQVHPKAHHNSIVRFETGVWHLKIAAPPVEGKANKELIEFLSDVLNVSISHLSVDKGTSSRRKLIIIEGLTQEEVEERLRRDIS
jgi:uncharacterized protein (TIGR00251 family)